MKLKHFKTSLLALATSVSALSISSVALTSCAQGSEEEGTSGNVTISTDGKTQAITSNGYATYTFTLATAASSASEFSKPTISDISDSSIKLSASIESVSGTTLKIRVSQTNSNSTPNSTSVTFSITIAKADGSWSQTIKNMTISNLTDAYSITYSSTPDGLSFKTKPTSVVDGNSVSVTFTIADGYELDTVNSKVTVGGTDVTSSCTFTVSSLLIPASIVTGDVVISLATEGAATASYKITYTSTPSGLTWITKPTSAQENKSITIEYSLSSGYSINTSTSSIKVGGVSITSQLGSINSGSITIPASLVTGDVVVTLTTKTASTYTVTYSTTPTGLTWINNPTSATSGALFTATFKLDGYTIDTSSSSIKINGTDKKEYITYTNGTIIIPADLVTGNIVISLATVVEQSTGTVTSPDSTADITTASGKSVSTVYTITPKQDVTTVNITIEGVILNSQILIDDANAEQACTYNITLDNCTVSNTTSTVKKSEQPFLISKNSNFKSTFNIILADNSENSFNDRRSGDLSTDFSNDVCFQSKSLGVINIKGDGTLNINNLNGYKGGLVCKGIQTKGDLNITDDATINVFAYDTAMQVGGALTINNGYVVADSYYDDAIKTKFEDPADDLALAGTGNLCRDVTIKGSSIVKAYAARSGINAGHDLNISGSASVDVYTSATYANADGTVRVNPSDILDEQNMFIQLSNSLIKYSDIEKYFFTIDFYNSADTSTILKTEVMSLKKIKSDNSAYFFKCDRPLDADYDRFIINRYDISDFGSSSPTTGVSSSLLTIPSPASTNTSDCVTIKSIGTSIGITSSDTSKPFDCNYKEKATGDKKTIDTTISSKGIKAKNSITVSNGTINIKSGDTCMVASYGDIYCNSSSAGSVTFGSGDINISGGSINATSAESDGIKAYGTMTVSGGSTIVNKSVEALEAGVINISGGTTKLYASDDGLNASQVGKYNTEKVGINISGGILDVQTTTTNDTDAVDSNNTITITGGLLISRVPGASPSSSLDWENGSVSISNATIILMGESERGMTLTGGTSCSTSSQIYTSGSHTVTYNTSSGSTSSYTFTNNQKMNSTIIIRSNFSSPTFK